MKSILLIQCLLITLILMTKADKLSRSYKFGSHSNLKFDELHEHKQRKPTQRLNSNNTKNVKDYLLGDNTLPLSYNVYIKPYLFNPVDKMFTYDGEVVIRIVITTITNEIRLHYHWDLDIDLNKIDLRKVSTNESVVNLLTDFSNDDRNFFTISLAYEMMEGEEYDLHIPYTNILVNQDMYGFFATNYTDDNGLLEALAVTNLEPAGARKMMPCYDEPNKKASVTVHIAREPGYQIVANMPIASEGDPVEGLPGWDWVHLEPTPLISTYLVCFAVHKLSSITNANDDRYKLWARPAVVQYGEYSNQIIPEIIKFYEEFTGINYQLPKYDHFAFQDFKPTAMENWGLVTFSESMLLFNPETDSIWDKKLTSIVVAHEAAHQWFGNLVTPDWWSNIWLSEGFGRYFEYFAIHALAPDWQMDQQYVVDITHPALELDAGDTHPVYADYVDDPYSLLSVFDTITYNKGGSLVRFMINLFGEDNFKIGIQNYLNNFAYGNAHQDDLFAFLAPHAPAMPEGITFADMMNSWTLRSGFPLITVIRDYDNNTVTIFQERFNSNSERTPWIIPLTYTSGKNPDFSSQVVQAWLTPDVPEIILQAPDDDQWLWLNIKQTGFYRVKYDITNWALMTEFMNTPGNAAFIDPINRAQIMDDTFTLARFGYADIITALNTTKYLDQENLLTPWTAATKHLMFIRDQIYSTQEGIDLYQDYMLRKIELMYTSVNGFTASESDDHITLLTRSFVTYWACDWQHEDCNAEGSKLFQEWVNTPDPDTSNPVPVDLRKAAYCSGQRLGGENEYTFLVDRYLNNNQIKDTENIIRAMGCASDTIILQRYLDDSLTTFETIALDVLESVYSHPLGVDVALNFLIENWQALDNIYEGGIGIGFINIASKLNTIGQYSTVSIFLQENISQLSSTNQILLADALGIIYDNYSWNDEYLRYITEFFMMN